MSAGMALFKYELRSAVREAQAERPSQEPATPRPPPPIQAATIPATDTAARPIPAAEPRAPGRHRAPKDVVIKLWLPLTPLWLLLAPLALLLAPALMLLPALVPNRPRAKAVRASLAIHPYRAAWALGRLLLAMSGTVVDVKAPGARVLIRIF